MPAIVGSIAPGKLVLMGEYAVLDGAPAIVTAVDRGVRCRVRPAERLHVETPDGDQRFVAAALRRVAAPAGRYVFQADNPVALPEKPGFGGSAAATVAAVLAGGGEGPEAYEVHRQVQGGGSGVDVAASLSGGSIRFQVGEVRRLEQSVPVPVVVWAGTAASTAPRVAAYRAWSGARGAFLSDMGALTDAFPTEPLRAVREAWKLLRTMARSAGIDYETPALCAIAALAEAQGGAAKPSGAGGGDCAVAFFPRDSARSAFLRSCRVRGLATIPIRSAGPARILRTASAPQDPGAKS